MAPLRKLFQVLTIALLLLVLLCLRGRNNARLSERGALSIAVIATSATNSDAATSVAASLRSSFRVSTTTTTDCDNDNLCNEEQRRKVEVAVHFVDVVAYFSPVFTSRSRCHEGPAPTSNESFQCINTTSLLAVGAQPLTDDLTGHTFRRDLELLHTRMGPLQIFVVIVARQDEADLAMEFFNEVAISNNKKYTRRMPTFVLLHTSQLVGVGIGNCAYGVADTVYATAVAQALSTGRIEVVKHPETQLSFLALGDLCKAVEALAIGRHALAGRGVNSFMLTSFNTSIGRAAAEVATATGSVLTFRAHYETPAASSANNVNVSTPLPNDISIEFMGTEAATVRDLVQRATAQMHSCSNQSATTSNWQQLEVRHATSLSDRHKRFQQWISLVLAALGKHISVVGYDLDAPYLQTFASVLTNKSFRNVVTTGSSYTIPCDEESLMLVVAASLTNWNHSIRPNLRHAFVSQDHDSAGSTSICNRSQVWVLLLDDEVSPRLLSWIVGTDHEHEVSTIDVSVHLKVSTVSPLVADRRQVVLVSHFFNEAFMLPYFIRHHAGMFDRAVLIDCGSTDNSVEIIKALAPSTWEVVSSRHPNVFDYKLTDDEVMEHENRFPGWWKIALTVAEFLVHPDFRNALHRMETTANSIKYRNKKAFRYRSVIMTGDDTQPLSRFEQLISQRREYVLTTKIYGTDRVDPVYEADPSSYLTWYSRFLHQFNGTSHYHNGRHTLDVPGARKLPMMPDGFIAKWMYTPWPDTLIRRASVGKKIPKEHLLMDRGTHHVLNTTQLNVNRNRVRESPRLRLNDVYALCDNVVTRAVHRAWRSTFLGPVEFHHECVGAGIATHVDRYYHWRTKRA